MMVDSFFLLFDKLVLVHFFIRSFGERTFKFLRTSLMPSTLILVLTISLLRVCSVLGLGRTEWNGSIPPEWNGSILVFGSDKRIGMERFYALFGSRIEEGNGTEGLQNQRQTRPKSEVK